MIEPLISAIIPTLNRPRELRLCLEGFALQTTPQEKLEVVVVDDGSTEDLASVVAEFDHRIRLRFERREHAGLSAARNAGIGMARGRFLILYDDDLRPLPQLVEHCLEFHREYAGEGDVELLRFALEPEIARSRITQWCFHRFYPFPSSPGLQHLGCFWGGAITCKRTLFRHGVFDPAYLSVEDSEFAARIAQRVDLRVYFRGYTSGVMTRAITLAQLYRREFFRGYFQFRLAEDYPDVWSFTWEPYHAPDAYILPPDELRSMFAAASGMERMAISGTLLTALWRRLEYHATCSGWIAAREGRPFDPAEAEPRRTVTGIIVTGEGS